MFWTVLAVALGFCGTAVLGVLGIRVFVEVQRLGRQVSLATERMGREAEDLERAANRLAASGKGLR